jgi:hypothetical protein
MQNYKYIGRNTHRLNTVVAKQNVSKQNKIKYFNGLATRRRSEHAQQNMFSQKYVRK